MTTQPISTHLSESDDEVPVVQPSRLTQANSPSPSSVGCQANENKASKLEAPSGQPELDGPDGWWAHWMS